MSLKQHRRNPDIIVPDDAWHAVGRDDALPYLNDVTKVLLFEYNKKVQNAFFDF